LLPVKVSRVSLLVLATVASLTFAQQTVQRGEHACRVGKYQFKGTVTRGQVFSRDFDGFKFALTPTEYGWSIDIAQGEQHHLANITGPRHFVPNPIEIEGWHFRNAANTGSNTGDVNAPQRTRRFFFSPRWPHCGDAAGLENDGQGVLEITSMELGNLKPGAKANIDRMNFNVILTVGRSACRACPTAQK
jgi:hypothetical protein